MSWQSPISPGISWYEATVGERPEYPPMGGSCETDVAIVGGGFTGLQAAYHLASKGVRVVLIDANRFGDGASGRNGGQLGTGQRAWPEELEEEDKPEPSEPDLPPRRPPRNSPLVPPKPRPPPPPPPRKRPSSRRPSKPPPID